MSSASTQAERGGNAVLVTGATGFLGSATVSRLLSLDPTTRIYAVIRDPTRWPAFASRFPPGRVVPVVGDIRRPGLGLTVADEGTIARSVGRVVHLAADIVFSHSLAEARATNVAGTAHLIDTVGRWPAVRQFAYVSTAFVAGRKTGWIAERDNGSDAGWDNPYEQSKYEAEHVVRDSAVPWVILRPSTVVCDDVSGSVTQVNAVHVALRLLHAGAVRALPGDPSTTLDVVPVDYVADGIARAVEGGAPAGSTMHLCAGPGAARLDDVLDWTWRAWSASRGWRRKRIPPPELLDLPRYAQRERSLLTDADPARARAARALSHFAPGLAFPKQFDTTRAAAVLGCVAPPVATFWPAMVTRLVQVRRDGSPVMAGASVART